MFVCYTMELVHREMNSGNEKETKLSKRKTQIHTETNTED